MPQLDVLNWTKKKVGTVDLVESVFAVPVKKEILHEVVNWQLASRRQGTAMVKTRGLVSGGGKKPFKQKGTGNARQGSTRSPLMPGGGKIFGPAPRTYDFALPKKVRRLGLQMALSSLVADGKLIVVDDMTSAGKTKELAKRLKDFGVEKAVLVDTKSSDLFKRASKNLAKYKYFSVDGLNVFDLLKYQTAIITKDSIAAIVEKCKVG